MEKKTHAYTQEVLFSTSDRKDSRRLTAMLKAKAIRKIAPRVYSSNFTDDASTIIKRNWYKVLSNLYPDAQLSHRSALELKPTKDGDIYLTYIYTKKIKLPGLSIHLLQGLPRTDDDKPFFENMYVSQEARAFLENLQSTTGGATSKVLPIEQLEERLESIIRARGEKSLNAIRDQARELSKVLRMEREFAKLNQLISSLLATGKSSKLKSPAAFARAFGEPLDPDRIKLFESYYEELAGQVFPEYRDKNVTDKSYKAFAFFEGYFSNYIEGTEFTVEEAKAIVSSDTPLPTRDEDSHDILGTYRIVSDRNEMSILPRSANELLDILRRRHGILLQYRLNKNPGEFKDRNNRAGNTEFVDKELVVGTLKKGFEWYALLNDPFAKAAYMMFLVSEVHPFVDGNGRIARIMMNAELSATGCSKIIIPNVFREDYMGALRKLTRQRDGDAYTRMILRAYEFSASLYAETIDQMNDDLILCNAFKDPKEGKLIWKRS